MKKCVLLFFTVILLLSSIYPAYSDEIMDRIDKSGEIRIGFRQSSFPFAYLDNDNKNIGFSVDMAKILTDYLSMHFGKKIKMTPITILPNQRIKYILDDIIDVEMGSTTYTQQREDLVDFSVIFFMSETTFIVNKNSGIQTVYDLNGKRIGGSKGTTNLSALQSLADKNVLKPEKLIILNTHGAGMKALKAGEIDAYTTDRILLEGLRMQEKFPENWEILDSAIAYDPYAYMLKEGNSDFRDFLNNTIRWTINTGTFFQLYEKWMGKLTNANIKMPPSIKEYLGAIVYPMDDEWYMKK